MANLLLIEDEIELALPLKLAFTQDGHHVDLAFDGEAGEDLLQKHPYDLLVVDWMLPGVSGLDVIRNLRRVRNTIPILMLTARDNLEDRVQGLDSGADDYLVKPFELKELLARVRALSRRLQDATEKLTYNNLVLDYAGKLAFRQGQSIELSTKEFQLLEYFIQRCGQVMTHEEIYKYLWASEHAPTSNVVAAQVKLLRRKVDRDFHPPLIHTVYGVGYRFGA